MEAGKSGLGEPSEVSTLGGVKFAVFQRRWEGTRRWDECRSVAARKRLRCRCAGGGPGRSVRPKLLFGSESAERSPRVRDLFPTNSPLRIKTEKAEILSRIWKSCLCP